MAEAAVDTTVLRRANVALEGNRADANLLSRRLQLLQQIRGKQISILVSNRLVQEYCEQLPTLRNDVVKAFLELVTNPDGKHVIINWKASWSGGDRNRARRCRYPSEDDHVLRTAIRDNSTVIYTEEGRMLRADSCIYREFLVHIQEP